MVAVIRRKYLGGAAATLGGLLAAACGEPTVRYVGQPQAGPAGPAGPQGQKGEAGAQGAQGAQGAAGIAAKKPPEVQVWHWAGPQHRFSLANTAVVEDFKARNERAALVDIQTAGDGRANMTKIKSFLAADTPPNAWTPWQVEAADLFSLGAIIDLDQALRTNQDWATVKPNMIPFLLNGVLWKGQQTLMPMFPDPHGLGYNTHILKEVGLEFPKDGYTWADFISLGQKAYIPEQRRLVDFYYDGHRMLWWMGSNGGFPIDETRTKLQWDSAIARETLEFAHEHAKRTRLFIAGSEFHKDNSEPYNHPNVNFNKGGRLSNIINPGTVTPPRYPDIDPGDGSGIRVTHYPLGPSNTAKTPLTPGNVFGIVVFKVQDEEAQQLSADLAAWSVREDVQLLVTRASGHPPSNLAAARNPGISAALKNNSILNKLNDLAQYDQPTPNPPSYLKILGIVKEQLTKVDKGEATPGDALMEAQRLTQPLLDADLSK